MHFFTKIFHASAILHVAFQGASGAILRGRASGSEAAQLPADDLQTLTQATQDLDNQLESFLRNWGGGHRKPDIVEITDIAKRQSGNIQISEEALQDLLRLIQSIEKHVAAILAPSGSSPSGTAAPPPSNTLSDPGPIGSSPAQSNIQPTAPGNGPTGTEVSPPNPSPFLTSAAPENGEPITTAYATSVTTGTRCKTTVTQTFTAYVYEDDSSVVARVVRSVVETEGGENVREDIAGDGLDGTGLDARGDADQDEEDEWEPWVEFDGTAAEGSDFDPGLSLPESWRSLTPRRRNPGDGFDSTGSTLVHGPENL
ncbi:hypothetical protein CCHL11_05450 [Colletotrichum chlorophyti]|uniref:Uncharacterized protein n=1 Tax=Colletotrichum chlorophyti TaxID=708187 RepID=A0A1Q8RP30_9PEZI|nr:hypothetical protein CCHL11_05450 [Colletotrichum chlorophyti]